MTLLIEAGLPLFDAVTAEKFFTENSADLDDENGFETLLAGSRFFNVYNQTYIGSIFVYQGIDDRYYLGGYAKRHHHADVMASINKVIGEYAEIYAQTRHKNAVLSLKKAGFAWYDRTAGLLRKINQNKEK